MRQLAADVPGARVSGTVVVHVLLLAIKMPVAQTWVVDLDELESSLINLFVLLAALSLGTPKL